MGAAAFLIAEFLNISYWDVVRTAVIPAALYYASIFLMVEADSRRLGLRPVDAALPALSTVTRAGGHHFVSVVAMAAMLARGVTAFRAVFWATCLAVALSFVRREQALWPRRLASALAAGGFGVVPVVATTATAGIIVGVVTLTGLGLKVAGLIVTLAGGVTALTVIYSALAVWVLGLAMPVTASYIIAAVMIAPALTQAGISPLAAHLFIFYYAVLSEVSPPTALSPFAAAAITGANPFRTTLLSWQYTIPAFLVPFVFTLHPHGSGLLLQGSLVNVLWGSLTAGVAVAATAAGAGGWIVRAASWPERVAVLAGSALLFAPLSWTDFAGATVIAIAVTAHLVRTR
jgi:TRAP transporter 4TM/12TM fusion protein